MNDKEFIERLYFASKRIKELEAENKRLREALQQIAKLDFRGNRPEGSEIAYRALKEGE